MTDYIISSKLSNETVYAYYRGRLWHWNGSIWKESHLMTQKFERAKAADKNLTPQAFLTNGAEFAPLDEYEIDCAMLDALKNAKPCKNAPIEPVEEHPTPSAQCSDAATAAESQTAASPAAPEGSSPTTEKADAVSGSNAPGNATGKNAAPSAGSGSSSDKYLTFIPESMAPKFDYSGLSDQTVADLHLAEKEYQNGKKMAARGYIRMGEAVGIAHDVLVANCDKHNNQYSEDNFRKWCLSIGITKDTAYRLLKISSMFESSSPRQQDILQELPPSLLYAAAKPSAPPELVGQVKSGDITTYKEYQELLAQLKAEKDRADAAEKSAQNARKENAYFKELVKSAEAQTHKDAEKREEAESRYESALADIRGLKEQNAELQQSYHDADEGRIAARLQCQKAEGERDKAEARAKNAEGQLSGSRQVAEAAKLRADKLQEENAALKKQPIAAVVDEEEVERRANQRAHDIAEDLAAEMTADLQARLEQVSSGSEQDARDAYDSIILAGRSITSIVQSAKMQFRKLPDDQRETAINQFVHTLASAQGEVSACL
ncbi:MAG: hypothetical protein UDB88_03385 [Faecalibacterium prausnitzii]|uniref:hypothetical protein n=1 Tax=Gemmiger formicilis TaxID=745368 RepID=UPI002ECF73E9|nr:hypothetical protein [Faecalibacterium prausnitzii]